MSGPQLKVEEVAEERELAGLEDGPHKYLSCSNCNALLVDLWSTKPDAEQSWEVRAQNCPWCDENPKTAKLGGSFGMKIEGGYHSGGIGMGKTETTVVADVSVEGQKMSYKIMKASKNAKPVYRR